MPKEVIGFYINQHCCIDSNGLKPKSNSAYDWLVFLSQHTESINVMYDLNYNMANLLRHLNLKKEQLETLNTQQKLWTSNCQIGYINDKYASIRHGSEYNAPYSAFSDGSQYMQTELNEGDEAYCYKKACEAKETGEKVVKSLEILRITADSIISPINQFKKHVMSRMKNIPLVDDLPDEEIGEFCYGVCKGGWFDNFKKGTFPSVVDLDIRSCYPAILANLPDYRYGTWTHVKEKTLAPMGFYKGNWTITAPFSPIMYKATPDNTYNTENQTNNPNVCPTGTWEAYATAQEIDFVDKWKLGHFEVKEGWEWDKPTQFVQPWKKVIERLYELKESHTGLERDVLKRVLNGIFGLTLEIRNGEFGTYFSPTFGACIESGARLRVAQTCLQNNQIPISIAVDGLVLETMPEILDVGDGLGQWKVAHKDAECIAVNAEVCCISGKDSGLPFAVTHEWLKGEISKEPDTNLYTMTQRSFVSLGKALNSNIIDEIGDIQDSPRTLCINDDTKRLFKDMPQTGRELLEGQYDSVPVPIEMLELSKIPDEKDLTFD